jgi:Ca2+-transporting ATPase
MGTIGRPPPRLKGLRVAKDSTGVEVVASLGLTSAEAAARLARDGANVLPERHRVALWQRVLLQLRDPLMVVLLAAAVLTIATGDWADATIIALVVVVNTSVGVAQEIKADREISALSALAAPEARVLRDGVQAMVPAMDVVVGDLLVLAEGDIVAADAAVVEAVALLVDEAALTGESVPVDKIVFNRLDRAAGTLSAGTVVVRGRGRAVVTATGTDSAMGRVAALMTTGPTLTPLQRRLVGVGRVLAGVAVALCAVVLALGLYRGQPVELMVVTAISLVVAAVPESLPAVVTLGLALGARRMAARHALIRRLPAVETLGSVTVIATDKTGTLTEGTMYVAQLWTPRRDAVLEGTGYAPTGRIVQGKQVVTPDEAPDVTDLLTAAVLCNDAALRPAGGVDQPWGAVGDPTEAALLGAGGKFGLDQASLSARFPRISESSFDSSRKRMSTVHGLPDGRVRVICKGAPEAILAATVLDTDAATIARATSRAEGLARQGRRVLAIAQADRDTEPADDDMERGLELLGLLALTDPIRQSAAATVAACQAAGITLVLITGDHPSTAQAVATELGIIAADGPVVDCLGLLARDDPRLRTARVFARATPEQKLDIIQARRQSGDVVAMTGDGVNDGPALHRADIGVAMGKRGTEVARQAADLVLADDDLATVVVAAQEGRRVYANIRRFLLYALSGGSAEILVMLTGPLFGLALPLLPAQILWINLITHGLPGVAMGSEPVDPAVMRRPPRPPAESVLGAGLWQRILRVGVAIAAVTLGVAVWAHATERPWQTMAFFALGAAQLAVALGSRARPGTLANPMLLVAVAGALGLQFAGVYLPPLQRLLGTESLSLVDLLVTCAAASIGYAAIRLDRIVHPKKTDLTTR